MLNLIRKEKVILRGLGRKGEGGREGGGQRQLLQRKGADRDGALQCNAEKVRQKHKNISRRQQHWVKCALCLSDVVVSDGFLAATILFFSPQLTLRPHKHGSPHKCNHPERSLLIVR